MPGREPFSLRLRIDQQTDSLKVFARVNKVVETRDVTWEATLDVGAPSPELPNFPDQERTRGLEDAPELGGTEDCLRPDDPTAHQGGEFLTNSLWCLQ